MKFSQVLFSYVGIALLGGFCQSALAQLSPEFYSRAGDEYVVSYDAVVVSDFTSLDQVARLTATQKADFEEYMVKPATKFIFGPLTHRELGGEQKGFTYNIQWQRAYMNESKVLVPYTYKGQWLLRKNAVSANGLELPLPYNTKLLKTQNWKSCTDPLPDHQDWPSFWYFWDPTRYGCDHKLGVHFQMIQPKLTAKTTQTTQTYPEYRQMIRDNEISMTFAFGYVEDPADPQPFKDNDVGIQEFRSFIDSARRLLRPYNYTESPIYEKEYLGALRPDRQIGVKLRFVKNGTTVNVKIVCSGSIDQMELFAKSFARDHDGFFGWFGHSRVGSGFDASRFASMVRMNRNYYSVVADYQLIYWAGCNSYSYYTKPFFDFKANLRNNDANGTKALDIISNGLPSLFILNAANAEVLLRAIANFERPTSYQAIVSQLEKQSIDTGVNVLVNVLGDEDNEQ